MISIRNLMDESEQYAGRFQALLKAYLGLVSSLHKAALPANPDISDRCRTKLAESSLPLKEDAAIKAIEAAGKVSLQQLEEICRANKAAVEDRDSALKEVVTTVAKAISSFQGNGERHNAKLSKLADEFDSLARVEDANELRRRLREDAVQLRQSVDAMRRDGEESVRQFQGQVAVFQRRLELARKEAGVDRLTGLSNRREAERCLQKIPWREVPISVLLFDIENFKAINAAHGTLFGDQLLKALAELLRGDFPEEESVFRWAADEYLVIAEGQLPARIDQCRELCRTFAGGQYFAYKGGTKVAVDAAVAFGAAQYIRGESMEDLYRRARETLDKSRGKADR